MPGPYVEYSIEPEDYYPWQTGIYDPPIVVSDGMIGAPDGPGWGVRIRSDWLGRAERTIRRLDQSLQV